ncbi:MAG TPA: hypothetical protein VLC91_08455 [Spongiibacteraceae bacterium]|nr:hypothetical protein [Spongiibacteraceae bacterium]
MKLAKYIFTFVAGACSALAMLTIVFISSPIGMDRQDEFIATKTYLVHFLREQRASEERTCSEIQSESTEKNESHNLSTDNFSPEPVCHDGNRTIYVSGDPEFIDSGLTDILSRESGYKIEPLSGCIAGKLCNTLNYSVNAPLPHVAIIGIGGGGMLHFESLMVKVGGEWFLIGTRGWIQ